MEWEFGNGMRGQPEMGGRTGQGLKHGGGRAQEGRGHSDSKLKGRPCITLTKGGTYLIPIIKHSLKD